MRHLLRLRRAAHRRLRHRRRRHAVPKPRLSSFPFTKTRSRDASVRWPAETLASCQAADSVLLAAIGGPKWDNNPRELRPETGLLAMRQQLGHGAPAFASRAYTLAQSRRTRLSRRKHACARSREDSLSLARTSTERDGEIKRALCVLWSAKT